MKEQILERLKAVKYPGFDRDILSFNFVESAQIQGDELKLVLRIPSSNEELKATLERDILAALAPLAPAEKISLEIHTPQLASEKSNDKSGKNLLPQVKYFVMISSGKGGVGKSTTSVNLAISLAKQGLRVGLLDGDIYGPNIPRMLGEEAAQPEVVGQRLRPLLSHGIYMMSMGVLIEAGQGLIWRGAMIMKAIEQLLADVIWPELDLLILDMPPGTGDAQITSAQSIPINAGICVSTPQLVALDDSRRAMDMFSKLHIPVAGIIENMSGFICPDNGLEYEIFGKGGAAAVAAEYGCEVLGQIPIEPAVRQGSDEGRPVSFYSPESVSAKRYAQAAARLWDFLESHGAADNAAIQPTIHAAPACS